MNHIIFKTLTIFVISHNFQLIKSSLVEINKEDTFRDIYDDVRNVSDKIFKMLTIDSNFTESMNGKLLLIMYGNFKSTIKRNIQVYENIVNASRVDCTNNKTTKSFHHVPILHEIISNIYLAIIDRNRKKKQNNDNDLTNRSDENNSSSQEFEFIHKFISKVIKTKIVKSSEYKTVKNKTRKRKPLRRRKRIYTRVNLKPWTGASSSLNTQNGVRRVFYGEDINLTSAPFIASFLFKDEFLCAGSILSKEFIITAATCLSIFSPPSTLHRNITVRIGSDYNNKKGELLPVKEIIFHPHFDPQYLKNNLAIARIKILHPKKVKHKLRRILFGTQATELQDTSVMVIGWGEKTSQIPHVPTSTLSFSTVQVYDLSSCMQVYKENYVNLQNFCVGSADAASGVCSGDTGAPCVVKHTLVGVLSFGPPTCGKKNEPSVFTNIGYYADWINSVIRPGNETFYIRAIKLDKSATNTAMFNQLKKLKRSLKSGQLRKYFKKKLSQPLGAFRTSSLRHNRSKILYKTLALTLLQKIRRIEKLLALRILHPARTNKRNTTILTTTTHLNASKEILSTSKDSDLSHEHRSGTVGEKKKANTSKYAKHVRSDNVAAKKKANKMNNTDTNLSGNFEIEILAASNGDTSNGNSAESTKTKHLQPHLRMRTNHLKSISGPLHFKIVCENC